MKSRIFANSLLALTGLVLCYTGSSKLSPNSQITATSNPFAIYQSAYGKLLARLAETTIDRIWHLGIEQIVPHYMSGSKPAGANTVASSDTANATQKPAARSVIESAKAWLQQRVVSQHARTNPYALSETHKYRVHRDLAKLMNRSYQLDPTHYGAYNSYNLFITHHTFGGTDESRNAAKRLARHTIELIKHEKEDPEPYLTAASASSNLFLIETEDARVNGTPISLETLRKFRDEIKSLLGTFETLQKQAEDSGDWDYLSIDRQVEIAQRYRFAKKTFGQFDVMIARAEERANNVVGSEVVEKGE